MDDLIQIKCPNDGTILKVRNVPGIETKSVTCPVCRIKTPFTRFTVLTPPPVPGAAPMHSGNRKREATEYLYNDEPEKTTFHQINLSLGHLLDSASGRSYQLKPGRNVIGRKAQQSSADIMLDTSGNMSMSREHMVIDVRNIPSKGFVHYVSLYKEKVNKTYIGNEELQFGDCIILNDGDLIRLPGLDLKFRIPDNN